MTLGKLLVQRGKRGRWYLRVAVPRPLHDVWGKRERIKALGTSDRDLAEQRAIPILAQWREEERLAFGQGDAVTLARHAPTEAEVESAAVQFGYDPVIEHEDRRRDGLRGEDAGRWRLYQRRNTINLETQARLTAFHDDAIASEFADLAIEELGFDLEPGSDGYRKLCDLINLARLEANNVAHQRGFGDLEADTDSKLVRRVREREATKAKSGETILDHFERYAAEKLAKGEKISDTIAHDRKKITQFADFVGKDRAIDSITPLEVADYRDALRSVPPKWRDKNELKGLSLRKAAKKARAIGLPQTAFTTVNNHLSAISPLYKWLARHPAWAGLPNPCNGLFHDKVKGKNRRPSLSTSTLNKILQSPLFTGFLADRKEHLAGNYCADDWRKWIPLVAMFSGARIGEIAQLRIGDVREEHGVWFVHICHDVDEGLSTKSGKSRPAAVHSKLVEMGFLAFVDRQRQHADDVLTAQLFPELKPNSRGYMGATPSRWWRNYLGKIGLKDGRDGVGAHSFRHTMADRLRSEAEILDDEIEVVLGHNQKTTTGGYGELSQGTVKMFKGYIDAVRFEGVDFSHLIAD